MTTQQTTTTDELTALDLVRQAAQRGRKLEAAAAAKAAQERAEEAEAITHLWRQTYQTMGLPEWMIPFLDDRDPYEKPGDCTLRHLHLPTCSPISLTRPVDEGWHRAQCIVLGADSLKYDDVWFVTTTRMGWYPLHLLDVAVADAEHYGAKWHQLGLEAARRNEKGLTTADFSPPAPAKPETPDLIDQTHVLLRAITGEVQLSKSGSETVDCAVVLTTAIMGVAEQLRRLADMREGDHAQIGF